jgi:hypothetical protein
MKVGMTPSSTILEMLRRSEEKLQSVAATRVWDSTSSSFAMEMRAGTAPAATADLRATSPHERLKSARAQLRVDSLG